MLDRDQIAAIKTELKRSALEGHPVVSNGVLHCTAERTNLRAVPSNCSLWIASSVKSEQAYSKYIELVCATDEMPPTPLRKVQSLKEAAFPRPVKKHDTWAFYEQDNSVHTLPRILTIYSTYYTLLRLLEPLYLKAVTGSPLPQSLGGKYVDAEKKYGYDTTQSYWTQYYPGRTWVVSDNIRANTAANRITGKTDKNIYITHTRMFMQALLTYDLGINFICNDPVPAAHGGYQVTGIITWDAPSVKKYEELQAAALKEINDYRSKVQKIYHKVLGVQQQSDTTNDQYADLW